MFQTHILVIGIIILLIVDPFRWEVFSLKRFGPKYKELTEIEIAAGSIEKAALRHMMSNSEELEDFNVKHFVDKMRDQRHYVSQQVAASSRLLKDFEEKMSSETKRLTDALSQVNLNSWENIGSPEPKHFGFPVNTDKQQTLYL